MTKDYIVLHPCALRGRARRVQLDVPAWQRAAGVLVLVHEAYHVRRWAGRWNEAKVECRAIREFKKAAVLLGASRELANELLPSALAAPAHGRALPGVPRETAGCRSGRRLSRLDGS